MKQISVIVENGQLVAGESSDVLGFKAGVGGAGRAEKGSIGRYVFGLRLEPANAFGFDAGDLVPLVQLSQGLVASDACLLGSYLTPDNLFVAHIQFNRTVEITAGTEMLSVRFLTGSVRFKAVPRQKAGKKS